MHKRLTILVLLISLLFGQSLNAATTADNADELIGTWNIYDSSNNFIDAITIDFGVTKGGKARFSFEQDSLAEGAVNKLDGYMVNQNQIIFNLINLGQTTTYIAEIDFEAGGGPGVQIETQLADCETVGVDNNLVKKKHRKRLASSSALCDSSEYKNTIVREIKLVKDGVVPSTIASSASIDSGITAKLNNKIEKIEGAWDIASGKKGKIRILTKDITAHHLGYRFTYKKISRTKKLLNTTEEDFISGDQVGFLLDQFLVINTSKFDGQDGYGVFQLGKRSGSGRLFKTPNGDCFNLKTKEEFKKVCTPNDDTSLSSTETRVFNKAKVKKVNSKVSISF